MLTIKNCQFSLYCHFNKIIKEPGISFQSPVLSQKHVRNVSHTAYQYLKKFIFQSAQDSKEINRTGNYTTSNAYNDVTDFKICGFHKSTKNLDILRTKYYFFFKLKKYVLLNHVPTSSSQLISASTQLSHPQHYQNQNIARNWAICPNLGQKIQSCLF